MYGIAILLCFNFIGYLLNQVGVPLPGNVIGMLLLTLCLFTGWIKLSWIETASQFFLKHMMLFFAPLIVGTISFYHTIAFQFLPIVLSLVGSTIAVLLITGWTVQALHPPQKGVRN